MGRQVQMTAFGVRRSRRIITTQVIALTAVLLGAPFVGLLHDGCDRCPPQCPMHAASKMHCHEAKGAVGGRLAHAGHCGGGVVGMSRPGCGHPHQSPAIAIARAVLPQSIAPSYLQTVTPADFALPHAHTRLADPPESPPPILAS